MKTTTPGELIVCAICTTQAFAAALDPDVDGPICEACVPDAQNADYALFAAGFRACTHNPAHEL